MSKYYLLRPELKGYGDTPEEAWQDAVDALSSSPGPPSSNFTVHCDDCDEELEVYVQNNTNLKKIYGCIHCSTTEEKEPAIPRPRPLACPSKIKQSVDAYLDALSSKEGVHEDSQDNYKHAIYESTVQTIYGENIWDYINQFTP